MRGILDLACEVLARPVKLFVHVAAPLGAVGQIVNDTGVGHKFSPAAITVVFAEFKFSKYTFFHVPPFIPSNERCRNYNGPPPALKFSFNVTGAPAAILRGVYMEHLRVNRDRMMADLAELSEIGGTGDGGVHRPALTEPHLAARTWLQGKIESSGLEFRRDPAGNCSGVLHSNDPNAKTLLIGSHLDSVPFGGRFDGALGVITGLEVLRTIREAKIDPGVHLEVIDFTDEEGTLVGLLGSRALAGTLPQSDLDQPRGGLAALSEGFRLAGITDPRKAARDPESLAGYLEVHIEQGPRLVASGSEIGIVSALVGIVSFQIEFHGRADHAGTTPMAARLDAGAAAAEYMLAARQLVMQSFPDSVVNFGNCTFLPGAYNIVPGRANLAIEFRSPDQGELDRLEIALLARLKEIATSHGVSTSLKRQGCVPPAPCAQQVRLAFEQATGRLGLRSESLFSGAGHDTQAVAAVCPAAMIFIPSTGGSHNPGEYATDEACENGANVILHAVLLGWGDQG